MWELILCFREVCDDKGGTGACRFANSIRAFHIAILEVNSSPLRQPPVENIGYGSRNIIGVDRPGASGRLHMFANPSYSAWSPSKEAHAPTCSYVATGRRACRSSRRRDTSLPASAGCMHRTFFQFSAEALAGGAARCAVTSKCAIPTHRLLSCKVIRVHVPGSPLSIETTAASRRAQRLPLHRKTRARHARIGNVCSMG